MHRRASMRWAAAGGPGIARTAALLIERLLESHEVYIDSTLAGDDLGEVDRKAECIVELEGIRSGDGPGAGGKDLLQTPETAFDGLQKAAFLGLGDFVDVLRLGRQFRVDNAHLTHHVGSQRSQGRLSPAKQPGMAHGPAQNPPEHVASSLIARVHTVSQEEG